MSDVSKLQKMVEELAKRENQRAVDEEIERRKKIVSATYAEAARYNNVIVALGFAAYFTILSTNASSLDDLVVLGSGAMVIGSLILFVGFEVFKLIITQVIFRRHAGSLKSGTSANLLESVEKSNLGPAALIMKVWSFVIGPTVILGFGGAGWLGYAVIAKFVSIVIV